MGIDPGIYPGFVLPLHNHRTPMWDRFEFCSPTPSLVQSRGAERTDVNDMHAPKGLHLLAARI